MNKNRLGLVVCGLMAWFGLSPMVFAACVGLPSASMAVDADSDGIPDPLESVSGRSWCLKDNDVFTQADLFVKQQGRDILRREAGDITDLINRLNAGTLTRAAMIDAWFGQQEAQDTSGAIVRLYQATFARSPDVTGFTNWSMRKVNGIKNIGDIAQAFAASQEFQNVYGVTNNAAFVQQLTRNVLGREMEAGGGQSWILPLNNQTTTRGLVLLGFSESLEFKLRSANHTFANMLYLLLLKREPTSVEYTAVLNVLNASGSRQALIQTVLDSQEYRNRFMAAVTDTEAPSAPSYLRAESAPTRVVLTWNAATDNVGVFAYDVYRDGVVIGAVTGNLLTYTDVAVVTGTSYRYTVYARDAANNLSVASNTMPALAALVCW